MANLPDRVAEIKDRGTQASRRSQVLRSESALLRRQSQELRAQCALVRSGIHVGTVVYAQRSLELLMPPEQPVRVE